MKYQNIKVTTINVTYIVPVTIRYYTQIQRHTYANNLIYSLPLYKFNNSYLKANGDTYSEGKRNAFHSLLKF